MRKKAKRTVRLISIITVILILFSIPSYAILPRDEYEDSDNFSIVLPYRIDGRRVKQSGTDVEYEYLFRLVNHRGYAVEAPENTLPAFRLSKQKGYDYVETDVQFTKDDVAVCLHDNRINRTARYKDGSKLNRNVYISRLTYEQALRYDFGIWKSEEYKNTKIPTFEQFIELCSEMDLHPYVEIKYNRYYTEKQLKSIVDIVSKYNMKDKATYICFNIAYLETIHQFCPSARLGFLYNKKSHLDMERLLQLKTPENEIFVDSKTDAADRVLDACMSHNIPIEVWVLDSPKTYENLDPYISGATTNRLIII